MRIHLYTLCWNDEWMLPYFFRHYDGLVDKYIVFDDGSTDRTPEILRSHPKVEVRQFVRSVPDSFVLSETEISNECWKESRGQADWVIITDIDEHLAHPDLRGYLSRMTAQGVTLVPALGFQMISDAMPEPSANLSRTVTSGAPWAQMMKPSIFNPNEISDIAYVVGRHTAEPAGTVRVPDIDEVQLLHYKYVNLERTFRRQVQLGSGLRSFDREKRWGYEYSWSRQRLEEDWKDVQDHAVDTAAMRGKTSSYPFSRWWEKYRGGPESIGHALDAGVAGYGRREDRIRSPAGMKLFVSIFDDARLLPHFLKHYSKVGVTDFHIAAPEHFADLIAGFRSAYNIIHYSDLNVADSVTGGVTAVAEMRSKAQAPDEWVVIVDLDEFVEFPISVGEMIGAMESEGANVARGIMYDRFAQSGQPTGFDDASNLRTVYPVRARFTKDVMQSVDCKGVLVKGHLKGSEGGGHHYFQGERIYSSLLEISHYKWNDRSLTRLRSAYERVCAAGWEWAKEYKNALDHYEAHGRFAWETFGGELVGESGRPPAELRRTSNDALAQSRELQIAEVRRIEKPDVIFNFSVDRPQAGVHQGSSYEIAGWVLSRPAYRVQLMRLYCNDKLIGSAPLSVDRPDVANAFPEYAAGVRCGFGLAGTANLIPDNFVLRLSAQLADAGGVTVEQPIAEIRGHCVSSAKHVDGDSDSAAA